MSKSVVPARKEVGGLSVIDGPRFQAMEEVAGLKMRGMTDTAIAKELNIKRVEVQSLYNDWKDVVAHDAMSRDTARDYLNRTVEHFDSLIKDYYKLLKDLGNEDFSHQVAAQINSALKQVGTLELERAKLLRDYGLLDAADLGDELAEREEKEAILVDIIRNHLCNDCKAAVAEQLSKVTGQVEAVQVDD